MARIVAHTLVEKPGVHTVQVTIFFEVIPNESFNPDVHGQVFRTDWTATSDTQPHAFFEALYMAFQEMTKLLQKLGGRIATSQRLLTYHPTTREPIEIPFTELSVR